VLLLVTTVLSSFDWAEGEPSSCCCSRRLLTTPKLSRLLLLESLRIIIASSFTSSGEQLVVAFMGRSDGMVADVPQPPSEGVAM